MENIRDLTTKIRDILGSRLGINRTASKNCEPRMIRLQFPPCFPIVTQTLIQLPSKTSKCTKSAPALSALRVSVANIARSPASTEGPTRTWGATGTGACTMAPNGRKPRPGRARAPRQNRKAQRCHGRNLAGAMDWAGLGWTWRILEVFDVNPGFG